MTAKVLVTDYAWPNLDIERDVLARAGAEIITASTGSEEEIIELATSADAIMTCWKHVTARVLDAATRCRHVARYGVGLDNIAVEHATQLGILVTNVPDYCADEVREHAWAMILSCARHIAPFTRATHTGIWNLLKEKPIHRIKGTTLGILGLGNIGRGMAPMGLALGMRVISYSKQTSSPELEGIQLVQSVEDLFQQADFVTIHIPLTPETRGFVGARLLSLMKPNAFLINTARGGVIDEAALLDALRNRRIAGAALDVLCQEPPAPGHPFFGLDNLLLTPHAAFYSEESLADLQRMTATQVAEVLAARRPRNIVNLKVLDLPHCRTRFSD